jgi:predicted transposase YdaD
MQLISGFIDTYLRLSAEEEEIFRAEIARLELEEQEVVMQIVTSWMEEGLQRGRLEGRLEGELAVIMRLLNRRIGTVEPELEERIRQLSLTQLEDLAEALLDFSNEDDLLAWLEDVSDESIQGE